MAWLTIRRGVRGGGDAWIHVYLLGGGVVVRGGRAALDALTRLQLYFQRRRSTDAVLVNPVVHTDSLFLLNFLILSIQYASVQCSCQPAQHTNNHIGKVSSKQQYFSWPIVGLQLVLLSTSFTYSAYMEPWKY